EVCFRCNINRPLTKAFTVYAGMQFADKPVSSLRFFLNGDLVWPSETPSELGLKDDDTIECMVEPSG
ncbi:hypothetical protein JKP88DRAFT_152547, partial [Tribonema minus]